MNVCCDSPSSRYILEPISTQRKVGLSLTIFVKRLTKIYLAKFSCSSSKLIKQKITKQCDKFNTVHKTSIVCPAPAMEAHIHLHKAMYIHTSSRHLVDRIAPETLSHTTSLTLHLKFNVPYSIFNYLSLSNDSFVINEIFQQSISRQLCSVLQRYRTCIAISNMKLSDKQVSFFTFIIPIKICN